MWLYVRDATITDSCAADKTLAIVSLMLWSCTNVLKLKNRMGGGGENLEHFKIFVLTNFVTSDRHSKNMPTE